MLASGPSTALTAPLPRHPSTQCVIARRDAASRASRSRHVLARAGEMPGMNPAMAEAMKRAMSDPKIAAQLQSTLKQPEVQQQMQQMQAVMGNPALQARMQELRKDPEFAGFWSELQTGGMQALMKYYNDPAFLAKLSSKLGDVSGLAAAAAPSAAAAAAPVGPPEVKDLIDAAKYGDTEAVEDFIAIGKDVGMKDKEGRTPLHFAAGRSVTASQRDPLNLLPAHPPPPPELQPPQQQQQLKRASAAAVAGRGAGHVEVAKLLIEEGAPLEATDSLVNTPLHYAAGYGRDMLVMLLLDAGADKSARNANKKAAVDLATADPRNPVSQKPDIVSRLKL
ncbi:hypothetical protein QJQ45_002227 [Haematococcus lacustris]|nr:hypothetical protein QJQ45_002227 [Haematococcus lacustris]